MFGWLFGIDDHSDNPAKWSRGQLAFAYNILGEDAEGLVETIWALQDEIDDLLAELDQLKATYRP